MAKYYVDIKFTAYFSTEIEAKDDEEAKAIAIQKWRDAKFGEEINDIDELSSRVEREDGYQMEIFD